MNKFYQILKIKPNATQDEIHRSFRRLAKETHPDLNGNDDKKVKQFQKIKEAYDTLSDPEKRARYDAAQVKPKVSPANTGLGSVDQVRDLVLALLNRQIRLKRMRLCDFFVGCVLTVLMVSVVQMRHTLELRRILNVIHVKSVHEVLIILGVLLGIVIAVWFIETYQMIRIHFKLKRILKRKG